ncbi:MAG TPA: hypothetical protein VJX67_00640, partial [Blastocatellia bacterium]|nr:hypothetical protein [Blastocatellia bacterium]
MNFKTEAQRLAWEKAREHLYRLFGEVNIQEVDDVLAMQEGSTCVYVRAFPIGLEKAGIEIFSHVVSEVKITEDLMRFLLEYNRKLILGAFGLAPGEDGN